MKIQILEQKKNPLLKREELFVSLEHPGKATPSRKQMLPELARALKSREDLLIIDKIFSVTGKNLSRARVLAYAKKEEIPKEKLEKMKGRMIEKKKAQAEAPVEAPAEAKPEGEKPVEEAKPEEEKPAEEPKPEEKKEEAPQEKPAEEAKE